MCVKVIPILKKKRTNQSTSVIRVGMSDSFMHGYYISVYKLQDELYLYRWRRGGETGKKQLGFGFHPSVCCLCICIKYVYLYQLHQCVFPPVVILPEVWKSSPHFHVCISIYPLFHHTGVSVTLCVSIFVLFLYFSSSVFNLNSIGLAVCLLQEPAQA